MGKGYAWVPRLASAEMKALAKRPGGDCLSPGPDIRLARGCGKDKLGLSFSAA